MTILEIKTMCCTLVARKWISIRFIERMRGLAIWGNLFIYFLDPNYAIADEVLLVSGDVLSGKILEQNDRTIVLDHSDLGRLEIPMERVNSVTFSQSKIDKDSDPATELKIETPEKIETKKTGKTLWLEPELSGVNSLASKLKEDGWTMSVDFSLTSSSGNTEERAIRIGSNIERNLPYRRLAMDISYYNKTSEKSVTDNKFSHGFTHDWLSPDSRMFFFSTGRYDYDEFESWNHRISASVGPGFHLIETDDVQLDLRIGGGIRKEYRSENTGIKSEGLGQFDLKWNLTEKQTINVTTSIFPVLSELSDFRTRTSANWRVMLSDEMNLSLIIGLLHEYQSVVDPDKKKMIREYTQGFSSNSKRDRIAVRWPLS